MNEATHNDKWALLLDFDGTLVEIAEEPDAIVVPSGLGGVLQRLRGRLGGALALVSGRSMSTIDEYLDPHFFDAAGLHGAEHRVGEVIDVRSRRDADRLRPAVARLSRALANKEGVLIEDKGCAVAVHWRKAPHLEPMVTNLVESTIYDLADGFRLQLGKAVAEIAPADASKGRAIRAILATPPYRDRRPIFIGDDLTDISGFEAVSEMGGVAVHVGALGSPAPFRLRDPARVRQCLEQWAAGMPIDPVQDFDA